jgi:hypothetical protein
VGSGDGEEDNEEPAVDEGRAAHVEGARAGADEDDGDRAEIKAKRGCDATQSISSWCDTGRRSREKEGASAAWMMTVRPAPSSAIS